jgi:transcriptional regulator with XRE-family HTH domain
MKPVPRKPKAVPVEWAEKIISMRRDLSLNQIAFGKRLGVSAMAVSRWERGKAEPSGSVYIKLGNLAGSPMVISWRRAGLTTEDIMRVLPQANRRLWQIKTTHVQIIHAGSGASAKQRAEFVAVPLLPVYAVTAGEEGDMEVDLAQTLPERLLARIHNLHACKRKFDVSADSRRLHYLGGHIGSSHDRLMGQIVVAQHSQRGLLVSQLIRFDHTDALVSDHREYDSVSGTAESSWRIVGKVLWWTGRAR